ncbi:glycosyltransferase family 2 protein [Actinocorallia libanotica]|uniref:Glycosyltransferase n=1 Tax=Actinocorallia libanotica TaxID=46162 RepID=A0ABP4BN62_9ACTN
MTADPTTIVIATRDRRRELARTLEHLLALPERPRVTVVDNGSRDGTADLVARRFPGVDLIRLGRNHGSAARNLGVRAARTPYVAFSDDDSWWEPGALRRAADLLDAHPRLALISAATLVGPGRDPDPLNAVLAGSPLPARPELPGTPVLGFLACASIVRREAFLQARGFHPLLFFAGEETLLALDLRTHGWELCHVPSVRALHHPSTSRPSRGRLALEQRNALLTAWLRRPLRTAARGTARLAAAALHDPEARTALAGLLRRLPAALRERRPLPAHLEDQARLLENR